MLQGHDGGFGTKRDHELGCRWCDDARVQHDQQIEEITLRLRVAVIRRSIARSARGPVHRADLAGMRAGAAVVTVLGLPVRLLAAQNGRHEHLHDHVAQNHGQTERREVTPDRSHRYRIAFYPRSVYSVYSVYSVANSGI
jgi:hypothetical protein